MPFSTIKYVFFNKSKNVKAKKIVYNSNKNINPLASIIRNYLPYNNYLTVYYQNARGLRTKIRDVALSILSESYDVICLSETWLNDSFFNNEIFPDSYNVFRCDNNSTLSYKTRGGGVLIALDKKVGYITTVFHS